MKKISINNDDCSFENKHKFEDLLNRIKALGGSIIKNGKQTCLLGIMIGCVVFSAHNIYKIGTDVVDLVQYYSTISRSNKEVRKHNDEIIQNLMNNAILVTTVKSSVE